MLWVPGEDGAALTINDLAELRDLSLQISGGVGELVAMKE